MRRIAATFFIGALLVLIPTQQIFANERTIGLMHALIAADMVSISNLRSGDCKSPGTVIPYQSDYATGLRCSPLAGTHFEKNRLRSLLKLISINTSHTQAHLGLVFHF